ncbi:hypothetical protein PV755_44635 [Streptomyces caniscabiei]|uniref:hypothetical protein n=1 Tax=Streptomyces caniscabiei TaxID=2746961 RepID=UPI0029A12634|nr:hypothetical protein [Streptomyces caniscabiei]MDX3515910.1 hypothetical protein [Streptomyces caniscabiei]MDX3725090.1 hypothetical protein [Streptomyces caniscabiei]
MKLDWDAKHGPVTGAINTGIAALAVGYAGHTFGMPWEWAALTAGAGLIGTHVAGRRRKVTPATLALRAAGWLGAGGWCSWAIATGPWSQTMLGSLTAGALGLGAAMAGAHHVETKAEEKRAEQEAAARRATLDGKRQKIADEWEDRIVRVCTGAVVQIVGIEMWESGGGFSLDGECGQGGTRWKDIAIRADQLASDARLPEGCGVEVGPGAHRGAVLLHVSTVNRLVDDVPYPDDYSPLTVNAPAPIGVRRDGQAEGPVNRQASMLLVGQRGSGKTNLMNVMVANNCRMRDSLTWIIDLNGGGLALKWMRAWAAAGKPGRPPVDWVADTPEKALAMALALVRIAKARKTGYQDREIAANDDKLPVDAEVPEIRVFNDEGAEIFSTRSRRDETLRGIADNLVQTLEIARAAAVNETTSGLRATQDVLSDPQILKQSTFKAGMKVADDAELNYFFGYNHNASAEDAPYPGCALVRDGDGQVHPLKVYRLKPNQILDIVKATADRRPELDELSRRAAGEAYGQRWMDTDHLFGGPMPTPVKVDPPAPVAERKGRGVTADWGTAPAGGDAQAAIDQAEAARRRLHEAMNETSRHDGDLDAQFMDILAGGGVTWKAPASDAPSPTVPQGEDGDPRRELVFEIVAKSGPDGIGPEAIRDAIGRLYPDVEVPHAATIGRWLGADPRIHKPKFGRYAVRPTEN